MTTAQQLDERYGRHSGSRRTTWIIVSAVAAVLVGAFSWMFVSSQLSAIDADDLGFTLVDEHRVEVSFQVTGVHGKDVVCVLEALDEEFGVVGWKVVEIPASERHSLALSETIPTVSAATTGLVNTCWAA